MLPQGTKSRVISELQFDRVRREIMLAQQVRIPELSDIVIDQRHRHDERHQPSPELVDDRQQLLLLIGADHLLEIAHHVHEHIDVLLDGRFQAHGCHEQLLVAIHQLVYIAFPGSGDQAPHFPAVLLAVGHQQQLVRRVELDQLCRGRGRTGIAPATVDENLLDEVFPQNRVVKPPFFLSRQQRKTVFECTGEKPDTRRTRDVVGIVDLDTLHPGRRRPVLEYETAEILLRELLDPDRLARLEVYRLTQCIATMAAAASDIWPLELQPGAVNQAANLARAALDTPVGVRLERALNAQVESPLASPEDSYEKTRQQEVSNRLRFVLETLRRDPPLHAWEEPIWLVAAATSLIQADLPPSDEADAYADVAIRLFAMLPYQLGPRFAQSIDERGAWWRSLVRRVLDHHRALPEMTYRTSLPSLWVASQVIDRLDHVMDVGVLRGIESMIEGTLHKERISASQEVPAALALAQGVMARAGAAALIADLELEGYDEVNEILAGQVSEAWDILDMGVTTDDLPDLEDYVDFYAYADRQQGLAAPLAPLVLALRWLPAEDLPATPQAILAAVGIQAPYDDDDDW